MQIKRMDVTRKRARKKERKKANRKKRRERKKRKEDNWQGGGEIRSREREGFIAIQKDNNTRNHKKLFSENENDKETNGKEKERNQSGNSKKKQNRRWWKLQEIVQLEMRKSKKAGRSENKH
jgi:hypothetical protein